MQSTSINTSNSTNYAIEMHMCVYNLCKKLYIIYVPVESLKRD